MSVLVLWDGWAYGCRVRLLLVEVSEELVVVMAGFDGTVTGNGFRALCGVVVARAGKDGRGERLRIYLCKSLFSWRGLGDVEYGDGVIA